MNIDNAVAEKIEVTEEDYREIIENPQAKPTLTVEYILEKMEKIRLDTAHIEEAFEMLRDFKINDSMNGGLGDAARAEAINEIIKCRETTLQKQLAILERMYDNLTREDEANRKRKILEIATDKSLSNVERSLIIKLIKE